jgi:hypothetical protein
MRNSYKILFGKPKGKTPLGKTRCRWEDNIRMNLREVVYEDVDWMHMAKDRDQWWALVNTTINLRVT